MLATRSRNSSNPSAATPSGCRAAQQAAGPGGESRATATLNRCRIRGLRSASRMATPGTSSTAAPAKPSAVVSDAPPSSEPPTSTRASADTDMMADTASAQPVMAWPRPRRRYCW